MTRLHLPLEQGRAGLRAKRQEIGERHELEGCGVKRRGSKYVRLSVVALTGLVLAGCEKWRLDAQVKELCAKDGGIKVYETVKLPPEKFNQWGQINFYRPTEGEYALGQEYAFKSKTTYYHRGNPEMWRDHYQVVRRVDGKLLGEAVVYSRRGGDMPGPWHDSFLGCPERVGDVSLLNEVFGRAN